MGEEDMGRTWIRVERKIVYEPKLIGRPIWMKYLWLVLLCEAEEGVVAGIDAEDLRNILGAETAPHPTQIDEALAYFEKRGMIRRGAREGDTQPTIIVVNYFKHQVKDVTGEERKARWKERQGTPGNAVEHTDRQTDIQTGHTEKMLASNDEKPSSPPPGSPAALHASCGFCNYIKQVWPDVENSAVTLHVLWAKTYPYLDLMHEARKAYLYEQENPHKAKRDHRAYFGRWLRRAQDTHGGNAPAGSQVGMPPARKLTEKEQAEREALRQQVKRTKEQLADEAKAMSNQPRGDLKTLTKTLTNKMGDA